MAQDSVGARTVHGMRSGLKWLIPGMRVKRWLVLILLGTALANFGSVLTFSTRVVEWWAAILTDLGLPEQYHAWLPTVGMATMALGLLLILIAAYLLVRTIAGELDPEKALRLADVINQKRLERAARGHEIVVVGGGTGLSTMLRGLKTRSGNITAIVTVSDDGGSSGRLQREFGILPPGDIRNCLAALSDEEPLMTALFNHRFRTSGQGENGVGGHSLGNLLLAALTDLNDGSFDRAVKAASKVLAIRGEVLPSTLESITLVAEMRDGSIIEGETEIVKSHRGIHQIGLKPAAPHSYPEVVEAIETASVVVIGPGSVYTSIVPNLLVPDIRAALESTQAICVYVCNVMTQPGETDGFTAADHVAAIEAQTGFRAIDYVMVNGQQPSAIQLERYRRGGADWVQPDLDRIREMGYEPIVGAFISGANLVRHDSEALANEIFELLETSRDRRRPAVRANRRASTAAAELHGQANHRGANHQNAAGGGLLDPAAAKNSEEAKTEWQ